MEINTIKYLKLVRFTESIAVLQTGIAPSVGCFEKIILEARESLLEKPCIHQFSNGKTAFELTAITHKEIHTCKICGETTTA